MAVPCRSGMALMLDIDRQRTSTPGDPCTRPEALQTPEITSTPASPLRYWVPLIPRNLAGQAYRRAPGAAMPLPYGHGQDACRQCLGCPIPTGGSTPGWVPRIPRMSPDVSCWTGIRAHVQSITHAAKRDRVPRLPHPRGAARAVSTTTPSAGTRADPARLRDCAQTIRL